MDSFQNFLTSMEEWKYGRMEVLKFNQAATPMNKGFQQIVNEMCFIKKILPVFHTSSLPY
jgi:hypothetical protein